jgi:uncharacterized protein (DUF2147 family)
MKKFYILAALLLATTSAHAGGISFQYEGKRVTIDAPRGCASLSCISITAPGFKGLNNDKDDDDDVAPAPARREYSDSKSKRYDDDDYAPAAGKPGFKGGYKSKRYNDDDNYASRSDRATAPARVPAASAPVTTTDAVTPATPPQTDVAPAAPAPAQVAAATPERERAPVDAAPASDPNSPVGVWAAEDNKGNVRIEQCGDSLCGYSAKSGEKVLINMKPQGSKWSGRFQDPESGRKYDSTMTMKGNNSVRVQGCAFGGIFCNTQNWKRIS